MKPFVLKQFVILILPFVAFAVIAQESESQSLAEVEVTSTYSRAGTIVYRLSDGKLEYSFISGRMMGAGGIDLDYTSRKIGDDIYLLNWHDKVSPNYISVIMDLENNVEYTTAIMAYGSDMQYDFVSEGKIDTVMWLE